MFTRILMASLLFFTMVASFFAAIYFNPGDPAAQSKQAVLSFAAVQQQFAEMGQHLIDSKQTYSDTGNSTVDFMKKLKDDQAVLAGVIEQSEAENEQYAAQLHAVGNIVATSQKNAQETSDALDNVLANILGKPIGQTFGERSTIKVFSLTAAGYRGYMAKVKLQDPNAVKLVLSHDKVGDKGETTSQAAKRKGATLAINGGGFAKGNDGLLYPMGITVVDGVIKTFSAIDLSFIGLNKNGHLVGGAVKSREQVEELGVTQGATFVPTLLENGKKLTIPKKYSNKKEPRTLIGHFSNGDLLFIVIDGRQKGSAGVTLEDAQDKLLEFNVKDAYNLDGGGSSAFYYNGKILNNPSDGSERVLVSNFLVMS
ncbi:phosphodiester glycosidase family protein [Paenibacillus psychroresistens]|nr:phosphodiester glycosidase family protein [Paenibacillus psychroresistens]